ncbi:uncharacterized protein [Montipora capricornis]|uniref:uncharacterized protein isoform X2 n=1 Tax=Montipora capricornis TaxID=246305 RepID=UPI0035F1ED68
MLEDKLMLNDDKTEENWKTDEEKQYGAFLNSFVEKRDTKTMVAPRLSPFRKGNAFVIRRGDIKDDIERALEKHIEGMEPNFKSASFKRLWQKLRQPLTDVLRPRKLEETVDELYKCKLGDDFHPYEFPTDVDAMQRDLSICKIGEILEKDILSSSSLPRRARNYTHIWNLLKNPLTGCFNVARLSTLMDELAQCFPRFELAGIKYKVPSKMSEVRRDAVICKVDEILNLSQDYENI